MQDVPETFNKNPNLATKNKYALVLSNFPNLSPFPDNLIDLTCFSSNVKSVNLPAKVIQNLYSPFKHERQIHPNPKGARDTNVFTITWLLDSKFMNYYLFSKWVDGTLYGVEARERETEPSPLLRDNCIERLDVYALDNTGRMPTAKISFHRVYLTGLGDLDLEFGSADIASYTTTFEYEQFGITAQAKRADGSLVLEPLIAGPITTAGVPVA